MITQGEERRRKTSSISSSSVVAVMESPDLPHPHVDASRPSLGFPLGTALLLIVLFSLSGIFSCCYHWDKIKSLRQSLEAHDDLDSDPEAAGAGGSPSKSKPSCMSENESLPVLMPGDEMPRFIAMPCPCEPPRPEKVVVKVEKPEKPPRMPVPLY